MHSSNLFVQNQQLTQIQKRHVAITNRDSSLIPPPTGTPKMAPEVPAKLNRLLRNFSDGKI
jgi:hypothetical protein